MADVSAPFSHPLVRCVERITEALDSAECLDPRYLPVDEKKDLLMALSRQGERLAGLRLSVVSSADDVADDDGARSIGSWLAHHSRVDGNVAARDARLATALDTRYAGVRCALRAGDVNIAQAQVIVNALDDLPEQVTPDQRARAEAHLVGCAVDFAPRQLRILGQKILEVVAPEEAEEHERRRLEALERRARLKTRIRIRSLGDGMRRAVVDLPEDIMSSWLTMLHAYTSPRRDHHAGAVEGERRVDPDTGERVPYAELLGQAFCSMLGHVPTDRLPTHGGTPAQVVVTISLESLTAGLGAAQLSTGETISAGEARRLACNHGILPAVLGGRSEVLDLGRSRRLFSAGQRKAMEIRDRACRTAGCVVPAAWCEAHHARQPWSRGGRTDLADGLLLCSYHHHRAHDPGYDLRRLPTGDVRFARRV